MKIKNKAGIFMDDKRFYNIKKIIGFCICLVLIVSVLPISIADTESTIAYEDDVEIEISTGFRGGKDIGFGFYIDIINHKTEDVTVFFNITLDYLIRKCYDGTFGWEVTIPPEEPWSDYFFPTIVPDGLKFVSLTAEASDTIVTRSGFSIGGFIILYE